MSKKEVHIQVTEITLLQGKKKAIKLDVDGTRVNIPVDEAIFANYMDQFFRENPTALQRKRFATLLSLMRAAYRIGLTEGEKS